MIGGTIPRPEDAPEDNVLALLVMFLIGLWLFLFLPAILIGVLLWKSRFLRTLSGDPQPESHVIKGKGGSRTVIEAGCEDGGDGGLAGSLYDVFLSFRGPDTRSNIADVLFEFMGWAGIHVFRDSEEMRRGEEIAVGLKQAIDDSKIYVVIFSQTYACSAWCLRELAMIVKCCTDRNGKIIMPVFFLVDPDDVKLKTSLYREAIDRHRLWNSADIVQEWEDALKRVARISGLVYSGNQGLGELARLVIQDVMRQLKIRKRYVPHYVTGINDQVEGVMELLNCNSSDVLFIIVHGMGGIGKTTLASVVFNKICSEFEGCSFVQKVKEFSLEKLTKKLLADILNVPRGEVSESFDGINEVRRRFRNKKVLIVLDDVNRTDQLMMFAGQSNCLRAGSRIVITTRDAAETMIGLPRELVRTFEMKLLDGHDALQLFSRRALGTDVPPPDLLNLSTEIVRAAGNLPLALEAVALQFHRSKDWRGTFEKLKRVPHKKVMDALKISYEELDVRQKQIFLDISCFPNMRKSRATAMYMWKACNFYPVDGIDVLLSKSLIKIVDDDIVWMHDQLQAVGRELVHQESPLILRNRSRLWNPEEAWTIIQSKEGSENVVALDLGRTSEDRYLTREDFASLPNLKYLQLNGGNFVGDFKGLQSQLRWLCWRNCPEICLATNLKMEHLTVLEIHGLKIGDGWVQSLMAFNLRVLELSECIMTTTPDLSACLRLERLILRQNRSLVEIHHSLGKLQDLIYLEIKDCPSLRRMPSELRSLGALATLRLDLSVYSWDQLQSPEFCPPASLKIPGHSLAIVLAALGRLWRLYTSLRAGTQALLKRLL